MSDVKLNPKKTGEFYDSCPSCGTERERTAKHGGVDTTGETYLNWSMYNCNPMQGGCGSNWTRTTPQGVARDAQRGVQSRWHTQSAGTARFTSVPSDAYRANFDRAFGRPDDGQSHQTLRSDAPALGQSDGAGTDADG